MTATADKFSFKALLATLPRGEPLDTAFLKEKGLSPSHAAHLAKAGWLTHLGRGVYMLPGDTLSRDGCLAKSVSHVSPALPLQARHMKPLTSRIPPIEFGMMCSPESF